MDDDPLGSQDQEQEEEQDQDQEGLVISSSFPLLSFLPPPPPPPIPAHISSELTKTRDSKLHMINPSNPSDFQASIKEGRRSLSISSHDRTWEKRNYIAKEILTTERNYFHEIETIWELFRKSVLASQTIPLATLQKIIPPVLEEIKEISDNLLVKLESTIDACKPHSTPVVGNIFVEITELMPGAYTTYTNNYESARTLLEALLKENQPFAHVIHTCEKEKRCFSHSLEDMLIAVIQRIPRYGLLLTDLLKATPVDHEDHLPLKEALEKVRAVAEFVNREKKGYEGREKAKQVFRELKIEKGWSTSKIFIAEVEIFATSPPLTHAERKLLKEVYKLYFFNEVILIAKFNAVQNGKSTRLVPEKIKQFSSKSVFEIENQTQDVVSFKFGNTLLYALASGWKKINSSLEELQQLSSLQGDDKRSGFMNKLLGLL
eukprot:TRINITY_DN8448_c1_g1_i1.p1 TRINITY_DN8448_c1_g1~~TRINITY_DN8448_c1_g1_i1.p1  ORF type:complete len:447 (-),score=130.26 TRINITY_DN8448_c1_g1_i1:10-1308(-)